MKKLIPRDKITETLRDLGYVAFSDEHCRIIVLDYLIPLLSFKYIGIDDLWEHSVDNDKLVCQNVGGFEIKFPLHKKI